MKTLTLTLLFWIAASGLVAQTSVDRVWSALDSLNLSALNDWRVSPDLAIQGAVQGDPRSQDFDDSQWQVLKLTESIYPDSCWMRKEIVIPERILGEPVSGPLRFLVSLDDYGYLWVNGEDRGRFPWDGEFLLTEDARPGDRFVLAILAVNTGGPMRLIRARIERETQGPLEREIENFILSLRVGQKLLSFDTYQTNDRRRFDPGIDKSRLGRTEKEGLNALLQQQAASVDVDALARGDIQAFRSSIERTKQNLRPVQEFAKRFTLVFNSNAHIDAAWLWRERETIEVCKNTFTSVLNMMDARPDFTYTQSAAVYYDWMKRLYPDLFKRITARIQEGRWEAIGGTWVEPDCNLPSGESWMRHLLYGKRYFENEVGATVRVGWNPDSFGYNWNMPQFYRNAGIDAFITQKIGWNDTNVFPHRMFWWQSPDGSRVLSYFPFSYVNELTDPYRIVDWLRQFEANTGFTRMLVLFGVGDHGGGPTNEMLDRIDRLRELTIFPQIKYATAQQYLQWITQEDLTDLPVWKDELYLEYHRGTFTTQGMTKQFNREGEVLLTNAEKFSSLASLNGRSYNGSSLEEAWRTILFNQFHDILPGSSIREVYIDATETYEQAHTIGRFELQGALDAIVDGIHTADVGTGDVIVVFNPLSWERTDIVSVALPTGSTGGYDVRDAAGQAVPSQIIQESKYQRRLLFVASKVPSLGYSSYALARSDKPAMQSPTTLTSGEHFLENEYIRLTLDPATGWLSTVEDKRTGEEMLSGAGNRLQILEDRPTAWDAWNIGLTGVEYPSTFRSIQLVEHGPVRAVLRVSRDYRKPGTSAGYPTEDFPTSFFEQDVILYAGLDRIEFTTKIDWWEDKTMVKVAFPLSVRDTSATFEIPYGAIKRTTQRRNSQDSAKFEVPALRWADLSDGARGVSLMNRAKYGYDVNGSTMRLSLLRSPRWPDPTADRGKHSIDYALYHHDGSWEAGGTVREAYEYNYPLLAVITDGHKGEWPARKSFVSLGPDNLVLTTVKKAEEGNGWIIQWYDATGEGGSGILTLPFTPSSVRLSNALEEDKDPVTVTANRVMVETKPWSVVTLKVVR